MADRGGGPVMQQFLSFDPSFNINSMLMSGL